MQGWLSYDGTNTKRARECHVSNASTCETLVLFCFPEGRMKSTPNFEAHGFDVLDENEQRDPSPELTA